MLATFSFAGHVLSWPTLVGHVLSCYHSFLDRTDDTAGYSSLARSLIIQLLDELITTSSMFLLLLLSLCLGSAWVTCMTHACFDQKSKHDISTMILSTITTMTTNVYNRFQKYRKMHGSGSREACVDIDYVFVREPKPHQCPQSMIS